MIGEPTEIFRVYQDYDLYPFGGIAIRYGMRNPDGSTIVAEPVSLRRHPPDEPVRLAPMLIASRTAIQTLMDELWKIGVRPSDIGTAGHLASVQAHLDDMRKIAFGFLQVEQLKNTLIVKRAES